MIERQIMVKELIPDPAAMPADLVPEEERGDGLKSADVLYKFMVGKVDEESDGMIAINQVKILKEEGENDYEEQATLHMTTQAFHIFMEALADFTKETN